MKIAASVLFVALVVVLSGCKAVEQAWVRAESERYKAVAWRYSAYLAADKTLDQKQLARRLRTVEAWAVDVREHGGEAPYPPSKPGDDAPGAPLPSAPPAGPPPSGGAGGDAR